MTSPGATAPSGAGNREVLLAAVLPLLHDPIERARVAGITVLGRFSTPSGRGGPDAAAVRKSLAGSLADPSP